MFVDFQFEQDFDLKETLKATVRLFQEKSFFDKDEMTDEAIKEHLNHVRRRI